MIYLNRLSFRIKTTLFAIVSLLFQGILLLVIIKSMSSAVGIITVSYLSAFFSCGLFIFLFAGGVPNDFVLVKKADRKLFVVKNKVVVKHYNMQLGTSPVGHKQFRGDRKTPEGTYKIDFRNPNSKYHLSLHIDYPNEKDRETEELARIVPNGTTIYILP